MYRLNDEINSWLNRLKETKVYYMDDLEELRSHILTEIDSLNSLGLDDEEAFLIARKRLGWDDTLTNEFEKVNSLKSNYRTVYYLLGGYFAISTLSGVLSVLVKLLLISGGVLGINSIDAKIIIIALNLLLLLFVVYILSGWGKRSSAVITGVLHSAIHHFRNHSFQLFAAIVIVGFSGVLLQPLIAKNYSVQAVGDMVLTLTITNIIWWILLAAALCLTQRRYFNEAGAESL